MAFVLAKCVLAASKGYPLKVDFTPFVVTEKWKNFYSGSVSSEGFLLIDTECSRLEFAVPKLIFQDLNMT